jgi:GNAT superfamily N-acetyltransferase
MSGESVLINENLRQALAAFSGVRSWGQVKQADGLSLVYAGVSYGLFNTALVTDRLPSGSRDFGVILDEAQAYFAKRNVAWSVWYCEEMLAVEERRRARIALATHGLKLMMEAPGMIADEVAPPRDPLPELDCRRVGDEKTRVDFSRVMSSAFHVPREMSSDVYSGASLWQGAMHGWVGYVNDTPVSTTITIESGDAIGLYAVATDPPHQRRGYGESLMRVAIEHARRSTGLTRCVLQSSAAGYPLYLRMGYRNVARFFVFVK